jgi:carbonic anhydrase
MIDDRDVRSEPNACGCAICATQEPSGNGRSNTPSSRLDRRAFVATSIGASVAGLCGLFPTTARSQTNITPDAALDRLMNGNRRYINGIMNSFQEDLALQKTGTADKQEPFAAVLSCADSRVPVEIVFDQTIGRVFVTRVAGNVATPEIIASLEYGAAVLGTRVIMVLAHESCGAVKAAVDGKAVPGQISTLYAPLHSAVEQGNHDYEATAKLNANIQAGLLSTASPVLADLIAKGDLKIVSAYYALGTGEVTLL